VQLIAAKSIVVETEAGPLAGLLHLPRSVPAPVIVCCHGMLSSKDSSKFALVAEELSRSGAVALRFDFSGCGESDTTLGVDLLSTRLRDLHSVLKFATSQPWSNGTIGLFGSSLGGYLSLLVLASRIYPIKAAVCWATPFDLAKIRIALENSLEFKKLFPANFRLGFPENLENLAPVNGVLLVHGQQDEVVPWDDALKIYARLSEPKRLLLAEEAEHRFIEPSCRILALRASLAWFSELGMISL